jgi:amino acid adenylation domain-containing protein
MSHIAVTSKRIAEKKFSLLKEMLQSEGIENSQDHLILKCRRGDDLPLSFSERRLWFLHQLHPNSSAYHIPIALRLCGNLDIPILQQTFQELLNRHEILRTNFPTINGQPQRQIHQSTQFNLPLVDLTQLSSSERELKSERIIYEETRRPFNLEKGPLLRAALIRLESQVHLLVLTMHHIISDAWSVDVFLREQAELYNALTHKSEPGLTPLPIQYVDYAVWQQSTAQRDQHEAELHYWEKQLSGTLVPLELPFDQDLTRGEDLSGRSETLVLTQLLSNDLISISHQSGATLFMTLLAAFQTLLHRYSEQDTIIVGSPVAGRNHLKTESLIGLFLNTIALRTNFSGNPTFLEVLHRVKMTALDAYSNQDVPFEKVVERIKPDRLRNRNPLFDVLFNFINTPPPPPSFEGIISEWIDLEEIDSKFLLTLYVCPRRDRIQLRLNYQCSSFSEKRAKCILQQYESLLKQIAAAPSKPVNSYSLVSSICRNVLPNPQEPIPELDLEIITSMFLEQASLHSNKIALCHGNTKWSYEKLSRYSKILAQQWINTSLETNEVIAVMGERSPTLIAAMISVWLTGGILLPIDRRLPKDRQELILNESKTKRLIYNGKLRPEDQWLKNKSSLSVFEVDGANEWPEPQKYVPLPIISPKSPAYIFFTSGSSGIPKAVLGNHSGLAHFLKWQKETFQIGPHDRCAQFVNLGFDVMLRDIFTPLVSGATLFLPEDSDDLPEDVLSWIDATQITVIHAVPTLAQDWLTHSRHQLRNASLRLSFFAGEPLTKTLVDQWRSCFPSAEAINLYGPTETTLAKCYYKVPSKFTREVLPIGKPLPQTQALVINLSNQLCGIGEPGEIVLRTPFCTLGYLNSNHETQKRFVKNPFRDDANDLVYYTHDRGRYLLDGSLEILGRLDQEVKIRGLRVQPDEVLTALSRHTGISSAYVAAIKNDAGEMQLVAYVVTKKGHTLQSSDLRYYLSQSLPVAMIPSFYIFLPMLPVTPNGKINRSLLPQPQTEDIVSKKLVAPRNNIEKRLVAIFQKSLKSQSVGVTDDFFDLGGHSILAVRLLAIIQQEFDKSIPLAALFQAPTPEKLAELLTHENTAIKPNPSLFTVTSGSSPSSFFCIPGRGGTILTLRDLARCMGSDQSFYGFHSHDLPGSELQFNRIEDIARHYLKEIRIHQPQGPYALGGFCFGSLVAFEMAHQLCRLHEDVSALILLEPTITPFQINRLQMHKNRYIYHAQEILRLNWSDRKGYLSNIACHITNRLRERLDYSNSKRTKLFIDMIKNYQMQPYHGKMVMILGRNTFFRLKKTEDPRLNWTRYADNVEIHEFPGDHQTLLKPPFVEAVASQLKNSLAALRRHSSLSGQKSHFHNKTSHSLS